MISSASSDLPCFTIAPALEARIAVLADMLAARGWMCATAESCTGGLVGASLTAVSGASAWYAGGVVSYANDVKVAALGVEPATLAAHGAVSKPVVRQMAAGVCRLTGARAAVSISGIAGPSGGTPDKPVGTVWFGFAVDGIVTARRLWIPATRAAVRQTAVRAAVDGLIEALAAYADKAAMRRRQPASLPASGLP
ncbi:MAG: CinA family protein [Desulfovibrionaceae bacterium]|nr:CinA family protein [Desulfovibrionaceae bacterium]